MLIANLMTESQSAQSLAEMISVLLMVSETYWHAAGLSKMSK